MYRQERPERSTSKGARLPSNIDGTYYAIADTCTHRGGPLSEGAVEGTVVSCPWHGATFDVTTGNVLGPPAAEGVAHYNVQVDGNDIKVGTS